MYFRMWMFETFLQDASEIAPNYCISLLKLIKASKRAKDVSEKLKCYEDFIQKYTTIPQVWTAYLWLVFF